MTGPGGQKNIQKSSLVIPAGARYIFYVPGSLSPRARILGKALFLLVILSPVRDRNLPGDEEAGFPPGGSGFRQNADASPSFAPPPCGAEVWGFPRSFPPYGTIPR